MVLTEFTGIVHGDVKPENILIFKNREGRLIAKLVDFVGNQQRSIGSFTKVLALVCTGISPSRFQTSRDTQNGHILLWHVVFVDFVLER